MPRCDEFKRVLHVPEDDGDGVWPLAQPGEIHLLAANKAYVSFCCPCGCAQHCNLPTQHAGGQRGWNLQEHPDGTITLTPSVKQLGGCHSHFFIRRNHVDWCDDSGRA